MSYTPSNQGQLADLEALKGYVEKELLEISRSMQETYELPLRPLHAAPLKPREGMIVFADGTDWNPGAGKGVYTYLSGAWSKL